MNKSEKIEIIKQNIEALHEIKIRRSKIDPDDLNVIPLAIGQNLVLFQDLYDFDLDGYVIIRIKDITSVIITKSQQFSQFILKEEGILDQIRKPSINSVDNWENVLTELSNFGKNIIVECEGMETSKFFIGKITAIDKKSLCLLYFNGAGEWDEEPTEILLKDITSISFDSRYINVISKYLKPYKKQEWTAHCQLNKWNNKNLFN